MSVPCRDNLPDERIAFFKHLLLRVRHEHALVSRGEVNVRAALVNYIIVQAKRSPLRTFIVFFDEAQALKLPQYIWLRELDNDVSDEGVRLFLLLEGDERLPTIRADLTAAKKEQIVARYMQVEFVFRGLTSEKEVVDVVSGLADMESVPGSGYTVRQLYRSVGNHEFDASAFGHEVWRQLSEMWITRGLGEPELPMTYITSTVASIFMNAAKLGWVRQPNSEDVDLGIQKSGFDNCLSIRLEMAKLAGVIE
jgi:hypothetical protein